MQAAHAEKHAGEGVNTCDVRGVHKVCACQLEHMQLAARSLGVGRLPMFVKQPRCVTQHSYACMIYSQW